jgi:hypothetical protein
MAFIPAAVSFKEYDVSASSSRRQTGAPSLARISLTSPTANSFDETFCAALPLRLLGIARQRSSRCAAALRITSWVSVSLIVIALTLRAVSGPTIQPRH